MATTTTNLSLKKPEYKDVVDIADINANMDILDGILLAAYPVGSIYLSVNSTSPATLFGGTWERITGKFLLSATDNGSSGASQAAGNTGGAATVTLTAAQSGVPAHSHGNTIKATTPALSHTITQPAFNTPKLTHTITQPVFKYTAPTSHYHYEHYRIAREGSSNYFHIAAFSGEDPSSAFTQKTSRDAVTTLAVTGNQILYEDGQMIVQASYLGEGHDSSQFSQYGKIYPCHTQAASGAGSANGTTASRTTNVGVGDHAAAACTRATDVAISNHAAAACTMSGSVSNNTAAAATSAHDNMPPYLSVYVWKRTA